MTILVDLVERHASEAAFLWFRRDAAVCAHHHDLDSISDLDEFVEAHLDGLRVAGDEGWDIAHAAAADAEADAGALFVATALSAERGDLPGLAMVLDAGGGSPVLSRAIASGLGWVAWERVAALLPGLLAADAPAALQWMGVAACAAHRADPGPPLAAALASPDPRLSARAARAAGELGRVDLRRALRGALGAGSEALRFSAAWSLVLLGDRLGLDPLLAFASQQGPFTEPAIELAARAAEPATWRAWIEACARDPSGLRAAVSAAGASGDAHFVPWLLEQARSPHLARVAGAALSLITGLDLEREHLTSLPPKGFSSGPSDDPDDEHVTPDPDEHLPWPDADAVSARWSRIRCGFAVGERYLLGRPITLDRWLRSALAKGTQTQRAAAALEIALMEPGRPLFEVRAPAFKQREALGIPA